MTEPPRLTAERLMEIALARGLALDAARVAALQPVVESLGRRLAALPDVLPPLATTPAETLPRAER